MVSNCDFLLAFANPTFYAAFGVLNPKKASRSTKVSSKNIYI